MSYSMDASSPTPPERRLRSRLGAARHLWLLEFLLRSGSFLRERRRRERAVQYYCRERAAKRGAEINDIVITPGDPAQVARARAAGMDEALSFALTLRAEVHSLDGRAQQAIAEAAGQSTEQ